MPVVCFVYTVSMNPTLFTMYHSYRIILERLLFRIISIAINVHTSTFLFVSLVEAVVRTHSVILILDSNDGKNNEKQFECVGDKTCLLYWYKVVGRESSKCIEFTD